MTCSIDTKSKRHLSAKLATALAISTILVLGTLVANAEERRDDRRGDDHRGDRGHAWGGDHYRAPPVVYGTPYYYPPPVVYGPAIGITLPGVSIGIR
jgi:hypothetical protein